MPQRLEATIIIPNFNGKKLLEKCIGSLERQRETGFKVLVVDNGSTDGSADLKSEILDLEVIQLKENTGFCRAVNIGLAHTETPYAILLNNDTEAEPYFVGELLRAIKSADDIFSCGAQMLDYRRRELTDNAGDLYTVLGWAVARGKGKTADAYRKETEVFSCCGGASIYRMEYLKKTGLLDERHFAYLEDVDLGYRAKIWGYRNLYVPEARVYHVGSATTGTRYNEKKVFLAARNSVFLIYKNMPLLQLIVNMPFLCVGTLVKWLFFLPKGFGAEYQKGIREGIAEAAKCKKVPLRFRHLPHYFKIELELFYNVFRVLVGR